MKQKFAVYIATTQGPVGVLRLTEEPYLRLSIASIGLDTNKGSISDAYHDFVCRDTGVIARQTGIDCYRLHLQRDIEQGDSWKLGAYIAHQLRYIDGLADLHAEIESLANTPPIILATGTVNIDNEVQAVAEIPRKLEAAEPLLSQAHEAGITVTFIFPKKNLTADLETLLHNYIQRYPNLRVRSIEKLIFSGIADLVPAIAGNNPHPSTVDDGVTKKSSPPAQQRIPANNWLTVFNKFKTQRLYAAVLLLLAASPLAFLSAMNTSKTPSDSAGFYTRLRLLSSANERCFDALREEAWTELDWNSPNKIHGMERACQLEIHTENTSLNDHRIEVYAQDRLIKSGVINATSASSLVVPLYRLKTDNLTLKLSARNGEERSTAVQLR